MASAASLRASLRLARLYVVLLALMTAGRWAQGLCGVPYEQGFYVFSIVIFTAVSCVYYGAFARRWLKYGLLDAVLLAGLLGLLSQAVILLSTLASYALGLHTYFNHPTALNSARELGLGEAMNVRFGGLVGNSVLAGILGALGWAMAGLLPEE
jgi:hypothetical protein